MICDTTLIHDLMHNNLNLVLKKNLLSLKNFYDIYNGALLKYLEKWYALLVKHIENCDV